MKLPRLSPISAGIFLFLLLARLFAGPVSDPEHGLVGFQIGRVPSWSVWTHSDIPRSAMITSWSGDEHGPPFLPVFEWLVNDGLWLSGLLAILWATAIGRSGFGRRWHAGLFAVVVAAAGVGWFRSLFLVAHDDFARGIHFLELAFLPVVPSTSLLEGESTTHLWKCPLPCLRFLDFLSEHRLAATLLGLGIAWILIRPTEKPLGNRFSSR